MDYTLRFKQAYLKIKNARHLLIVSHINPDGDALSSISIFLELASQLGVKVTAYAGAQKGHNFVYLPRESLIISDKSELSALTAYDVMVILDCGSMARTDLAEEIMTVQTSIDRPYIIEFDHHPKIDDFADLEIRQPAKAATVEVVYNFLKANQVSINKNLANCILTGLLTDTGNFLYASSSNVNIAIASEMLSYGAQFPKIVNNTLRNKNLLSMRLLGIAVNNLRLNEKYNLAYSVITKADIDELMERETPLEIEKYLNSDIYGDISGFLSTLSNVKATMFLREEADGKIKGSLRTSKPGVDISGLAKKLGGGGHAKASGFLVRGHLVKTETGWQII